MAKRLPMGILAAACYNTLRLQRSCNPEGYFLMDGRTATPSVTKESAWEAVCVVSFPMSSTSRITVRASRS